MQTAEDRRGQEGPIRRRVQPSWPGRIAHQGLMASVAIVVTNILIQNLPQAVLAQHNQMIQAFSADGSDHTFDIGILPR